MRRLIYREDKRHVWTECICGWHSRKYPRQYGRGQAVKNAEKAYDKHECKP